MQSAAALKERYDHLKILPVCADYTTDFHLPEIDGAHPVVFFPGSTIGNFTPEEAADFLRHLADVVGPGGGLLIGVDLRKDVAVIEAAYNDAQGVTAAFNKNMLVRINEELGGTFQLDRFQHHAFFNETHSRIEMHLVSLGDQCVRVGDVQIPFRTGETILTEYSYKYSLERFAALAHEAGFAVEQVWTDERDYFSVQYLVAR
jgi:dimethylhistidine N-methyltransferase